MYNVEFYNEAKIDYIEIWKYIAKDNLFHANEVLNKIDRSIDIICEFPFIWKNMWNNKRLIVEPTYRFKIVYEIKGSTIYIISLFKYQNLFT